MGLFVTLDDMKEPSPTWSGSYGAFYEFRCLLSKLAFGYKHDDTHENKAVNILLDHSDCDGKIGHTRAKKLGKTLERLSKDKKRMFVFLLKMTSPEWKDFFIKSLNDWVKLCRKSATSKRPIIFG